MENTIYEILKIILPVIMTGIFTFLVTKYTYDKNRPLDKLEITYNRVYYPLYKMTSNYIDDIKSINNIIDNAKMYFVKYDKYIDITTKNLFKTLCTCNRETKKKCIFQQFKDNINEKNLYLRRRLGYLQPSFSQIYKYSTSATKSFYRIFIELGIAYISIFLCIIIEKIPNYNVYIVYIIIIIVMSLGFVSICEVIWCIIRALYYIIRK